MLKKRQNKGFTLAELLIVIAIIAVLIAIAVPVFASSMKRANEATDCANVRSLKAAAVAWYLDNEAESDSTKKVALPTTLTLYSDGTAAAPGKNSSGNPVKFKLASGENEQLSGLGLSGDLWGAGDDVKCNVGTNGEVTFGSSTTP